jgi:hypothetical protein
MDTDAGGVGLGSAGEPNSGPLSPCLDPGLSDALAPAMGGGVEAEPSGESPSLCYSFSYDAALANQAERPLWGPVERSPRKPLLVFPISGDRAPGPGTRSASPVASEASGEGDLAGSNDDRATGGFDWQDDGRFRVCQLEAENEMLQDAVAALRGGGCGVGRSTFPTSPRKHVLRRGDLA